MLRHCWGDSSYSLYYHRDAFRPCKHKTAWKKRKNKQRNGSGSLSAQVCFLQLYKLCAQRPIPELAIGERHWLPNIIPRRLYDRCLGKEWSIVGW